MKKHALIWGLVLAAILGACASPPEVTTPVEVYRDQIVAIRISSSQVVVQNVGSQPLYSLLFRAEDLPYIDWAPCWDPQSCPDLAILPGEEEITSLKGFVDRKTEVIAVYYWHLVKTTDDPGYLMQDLGEQFIEIP